jgi:hypothetical protein
MGKKPDENVKKFKDETNKSWVADADGKRIKIGENAAQIIDGKCATLEIREMLFGDPANTWRIVITTDGIIHLLKTSRALK